MNKVTSSSYDCSISLIRLFAMCCILLCHLFSWFGITALAQLFNVGVPIFLLISGFLHGGKSVKPHPFFANRYLRLTLPVCFFILLLSGYLFLFEKGSAAFGTIPLYMLNLQGLSFVCGYIPYTELCAGTGHLWFLTVLFICYFCLPIVKVAEKRVELTHKHLIALLIVSCAAVAVLPLAHIYVSYFQIFFIGYTCKKYAWEIRVKSWLLWTVLMLAGIAVRLLFVLRNMDGSVWYMSVVSLQQNMLAFWIFSTFRIVYAWRPTLFNVVAQNKWIRHADSLSFYVYIVHYMFLVEPFNVSQLGIGRFFELIVFALATVGSAEALRGVTILVQKAIRPLVKEASPQT